MGFECLKNFKGLTHFRVSMWVGFEKNLIIVIVATIYAI